MPFVWLAAVCFAHWPFTPLLTTQSKELGGSDWNIKKGSRQCKHAHQHLHEMSTGCTQTQTWSWTFVSSSTANLAQVKTRKRVYFTFYSQHRSKLKFKFWKRDHPLWLTVWRRLCSSVTGHFLWERWLHYTPHLEKHPIKEIKNMKYLNYPNTLTSWRCRHTAIFWPMNFHSDHVISSGFIQTSLLLASLVCYRIPLSASASLSEDFLSYLTSLHITWMNMNWQAIHTILVSNACFQET